MKVFSDDLLFAADVVQMSALCVLDLTAGFDTVHHDLLLVRLERQFALRGIVLVCDGVARIWCEGHNSGSSYMLLIAQVACETRIPEMPRRRLPSNCKGCPTEDYKFSEKYCIYMTITMLQDAIRNISFRRGYMRNKTLK